MWECREPQCSFVWYERFSGLHWELERNSCRISSKSKLAALLCTNIIMRIRKIQRNSTVRLGLNLFLEHTATTRRTSIDKSRRQWSRHWHNQMLSAQSYFRCSFVSIMQYEGECREVSIGWEQCVWVNCVRLPSVRLYTYLVVSHGFFEIQKHYSSSDIVLRDVQCTHVT